MSYVLQWQVHMKRAYLTSTKMNIFTLNKGFIRHGLIHEWNGISPKKQNVHLRLTKIYAFLCGNFVHLVAKPTYVYINFVFQIFPEKISYAQTENDSTRFTRVWKGRHSSYHLFICFSFNIDATWHDNTNEVTRKYN